MISHLIYKPLSLAKLETYKLPHELKRGIKEILKRNILLSCSQNSVRKRESLEV